MDTKSILIWVGVIVVTVGAIVGLYFLSGGNSNSSGITLAKPVSAQDWRIGPDNARAVLVEYGDFECPACAVYEPIISQLMNEFNGQVQFVFREFPLRQIHPNAQLAAQAAEAAGKQGQFWAMKSKLYQTQKEWSDLSNSQAQAKFVSYAQGLGLNTTQFSADLNSSGVLAKIDDDLASGNASRIQGTPTFFLNGKDAGYPQSYDALKAEVQKVLQ